MYVCCSLIVCNLYPFSQTVLAGDVAVDEAVEQIDIGICTFQAQLHYCLPYVTTVATINIIIIIIIIIFFLPSGV